MTVTVIGILAGLVLTSISGASKRAKDGRIISAFGQMGTIAKIFYDNNNNTYNGIATDADVTDIGNAINDTAISSGANFYVFENSGNNEKYCAKALLNSGRIWCIDDTQNAVADTGTNNSAICNDAGNTNCD